jgi:DNA (cytosine-5)-methyltransferase 1
MVTRRPRLLDLFCGAGGCSVGYARAGWDVVGVDMDARQLGQYPFQAVRADALEVLASWDVASVFDAVHASPPCQAYVGLAGEGWPDLVPAVREALQRTGLPWVIENVPTAPVTGPTYCGQAFGLHVKRHRVFESSAFLMSPGCACGTGVIRAYYGKPGLVAWKPPGWDNVQKQGRPPLYRGTVDQAPTDMGIDWMTWDGLREAIPPAYTEHVGAQLLDQLDTAAGRGATRNLARKFSGRERGTVESF